MSILYRLSDRIPIKIDTITVVISPLTLEQKSEVQSGMMNAVKDPMRSIKAAKTAIKYAVKEVHGITDYQGNPYQVEIGPDGVLTDECLNDLLNLQENTKLTYVCSQLINGMPMGFINPHNGELLEGVQIEKPLNNAVVPAKKPKARKQK